MILGGSASRRASRTTDLDRAGEGIRVRLRISRFSFRTSGQGAWVSLRPMTVQIPECRSAPKAGRAATRDGSRRGRYTTTEPRRGPGTLRTERRKLHRLLGISGELFQGQNVHVEEKPAANEIGHGAARRASWSLHSLKRLAAATIVCGSVNVKPVISPPAQENRVTVAALAWPAR